ncbi:hypothetical protein A3Q35_10845 [Aeribacillus pallidus]|nr:hypothetical protein A3Q35_10845 [Aeribacillus pallidus]
MKRRANKSGLHVNPLSSKKNTVAIFFIDHADQFRQIFGSRSLTNHHVHSTGKSVSCLLFCRTFLTRPHDANSPTLLAVSNKDDSFPTFLHGNLFGWILLFQQR